VFEPDLPSAEPEVVVETDESQGSEVAPVQTEDA